MLGDRLRQVRLGNRLSQVAFAGRLGVSQTALVAYERGDRDPPASAIIALCENFGVDPAWVLFGKSKRSENEINKITACNAFALKFLEEQGYPITVETLNRAVAVVLKIIDTESDDFSLTAPVLQTVFPEGVK